MLTFDQLPEINSERWLSLEDLDGEVWKDVVGYEGIYKVSNYGRVKSLERIYLNRASEPNGATRLRKERILVGCLNKYGYWQVSLKIPNGKMRGYRIHRLVAVAFIPNPKCKDQIDHIDTNPCNNITTNLRWCTAKENKHNPITFKRHLEMIENKKRPIVMLNPFGDVINEFDSLTAAAAFIGDEPKSIVGSLKKGVLRSGYRFVYKDEYQKDKDYCKIKIHSQYIAVSYTSVAVYKDGKIIDVFLDQIDAAKHYGVHQSMINRRCRFYKEPQTAKKKFKTPINGTDAIYNYRDISDEDKKTAIAFLKRKYMGI